MGASGGSAPKPWAQYSVRTTFIRVPSVDWAAVKLGSKSEFRAAGRHMSQVWSVIVPTPVVVYVERSGTYDSKMMVLEETWREPLGAITSESLEREGFQTVGHFRRYWMQRTRRRFTPLTQVQVYRLRPFRREDIPTLGALLIERLYYDHLDP